MKKIHIITTLIFIMILTGCTQYVQYDETLGIISHNNNLQEALDKCIVDCESNKDSLLCLSENCVVQPKITECNENQCICIC